MESEFETFRRNLPRFRQPSAADLCVPVLHVTSREDNSQVHDLLTRHRDLSSLPVLEDDRPIGLINRTIFLAQMAKPYARELYSKKSCIAFMDKDPLIVEADLGIDHLVERAVEIGDKALIDGFIIVRDGRYQGLGYGMTLMRMVSDMQAEKHHQIMTSIEYASVIQQAMLRRSRDEMTATLHDAELIWQPRDVVGGDFYHFIAAEDGWFAAIADCTGHGVPGAFMTMIASAALAQTIENGDLKNPAALMSGLNRRIKEALNQKQGAQDCGSDDGLDVALIWFSRSDRILTFAGAKLQLFIREKGAEAVQIVDGDRMGVGYVSTSDNQVWKNRTVPLKDGDLCFVTTDGLIDQIGGPRRIGFGKRRIRDHVMAHNASAKKIGAGLVSALTDWQGEERRRDDVTFFCFRT